jgi:hypothetical protein
LDTEFLVKKQKEVVGKSKKEAIMILNHKIAFRGILINKNSLFESFLVIQFA